MERIVVLIVAYNGAPTLSAVLDRLPAGFRARVDEILVCDDGAYDVGLQSQTQSDLPLNVIRHRRNLGYGGNQKAGFRWAIDHDRDIVVLLHGDGQYAPEVIDDVVAPLEAGEADAVFGSRMTGPGSARLGGMPLYKYVGNRILTKFSNAMAGMSLTEWHSGYRAYRVDALRDIPFESNSDGFDFDTEIILQLHEARKVIVEVPIPTYYEGEIYYANGLRYAKDVAIDAARYRAHKIGFGSGEMAFNNQRYEWKFDTSSSHGQLVSWLGKHRPCRILDVGCSDGLLGERFRVAGHTVFGVDNVKEEGVSERLDGFVEADLNEGLPREVGTDFDVVVAADVLEHVVDPAALLTQLRDVLAPGGRLMVSVPNFAHWYPRLRVLVGRFDYDRRGIFDVGHLRFFTRATFERIAEEKRLRVLRRSTVGIPVEVADRGGDVPRSVKNFVGRIDRKGVDLWPNLFGYQFLYELEPV